MTNDGRWTRGSADLGTGKPVFPRQPDWFRDNRDFGKLRAGLERRGFAATEIDGIMGGNWYGLFRDAFAPEWAA